MRSKLENEGVRNELRRMKSSQEMRQSVEINSTNIPMKLHKLRLPNSNQTPMPKP